MLWNSWTIRSLQDLVRAQAPNVCFLMETRLDRDRFVKRFQDLADLNKLIVKKLYLGRGLVLIGKRM